MTNLPFSTLIHADHTRVIVNLNSTNSAPTLTVHGLNELSIGLGLVDLVEEELHRVDRVQWLQQFAQDPHTV